MDKRFKDNEARSNYLDQELDKLVKDQENNLLVDFDKAIEEYQNKNNFYKVKFLNEIYNIPKQMPFNFGTFFFRYCYKKINGKITIDVPDEKIMLFIELMFGKEILIPLESTDNKAPLDFVFEKLAMPILEKWGYGVKNKSQNMEKKIL